MPDWWEDEHGLDKLVDDSKLDKDGDGLNNLTEFILQTLPENPDTDGDGYNDGREVDLAPRTVLRSRVSKTNRDRFAPSSRSRCVASG